MANAKEYAYYQKGNKLAIVEKDTAFNNDPNSTDYGPGSNRAQFKSPLTSVADALEIEYTYSPDYIINGTDAVDTQIDKYASVNKLSTVTEGGV